MAISNSPVRLCAGLLLFGGAAIAEPFALQQIEFSPPNIISWTDEPLPMGTVIYPGFRRFRLNMASRFLPELALSAPFEFKLEAPLGYSYYWDHSYYSRERGIDISAPLPANARKENTGKFNFNVGYQF